MNSNLKVYTSFVSPATFDKYIQENYLPIIIVRNIAGSKVIGKYSGTAIHFKDLAPSNVLFQKRRDEKISQEEYFKEYIIEQSENNLEEILRKIEYLAELCNAKGVILFGYGSDSTKCHRSILAQLINSTGYFESEVVEINGR